ncbi:MAG TPA: Trk system potassium transporter TrkA [Spirochaetota bacterium]|nr:Trk system potassium transporter TrkA [Spirochaetota bacterium]HPI89989.1 Trk system potassium transporter TrkA [Spirochaetota bacterium]HPR48424.1 Trk system potassium transporter TrkA [Spirochaetota bacterium]
MHVVILGAGVVGFQIASELISEGKDVVLIEKDTERANYVSNHLDCMVINDEGTSIKTLKRAGIDRANFFISVTNSDEMNMITCAIVANEFTVPFKIARVRNLDYSKGKIFEKPFLGIDFIVNSEVETARLIANTVALGANSDVMLFQKKDIQMRNIIVEKSSFFCNRTLKEIRKTLTESFLVSGILRGDSFIIPSGDTVIRENDNIYLLATKDNLTKIFIKVGRKSDKIDNIIIVGGGKIGSLVCRYLIRTGRKITIIDSGYENCKRLSAEFPDALVINADVSDEDIFREEQLDRHDLIITATDNQELNILTSVYAKSLGIKRSVALVTKSNYLPIASKLEIDATISPKNSTVDAILKYIRRGDIKSVHTLFNGKAEVIEFSVDQKSPISEKKIQELPMPDNSLILSVIRHDEDIIPTGNFSIQPGDTVITIARKDSISKLEELFISQ